MKKYRFIIAFIAIILTALVSYGVFTAPKPQSTDSEHFSAYRVAKDIEVISKKPHSIEHPENRAEVRNYWAERIAEITPEAPQIMAYDSVDMINGAPYDIANIYAKVDPIIDDPDHPQPTYLLLVAHIDSRHALKVLKDTVYSFGAADDGYGCATIVENLALAMKYRGQWRQGIKVLLTDSEEKGLHGMKSAINHNSEIFENVGLVINLDSRGTKGPVLLYETGDNNEKVYDLYQYAKSPHTYSFANVVNKMLPFFTDYSPLKEDFQGMNICNLYNINYYHTDLDNYSNISLTTIQHFGAQVEPIIAEYLTNHEYRDLNYFKGESDKVAFTLPLLGLFTFSKGGYALVNAIALALFALILCFAVIGGRIRFGKVVASSAKLLLWCIIALAAGTLIAWLAALIVGADFKLFGVIWGIKLDRWIMIAFVAITTLLYLLIYRMKSKRYSDKTSSSAIRKSASASGAIKYSYNTLYASLFLLLILSAAAYFAFGENFFFMIPLLVASASIFLWRIIRWRGVLLLGTIVILLHAFSFLYILSIALTIGAFGGVLLFVVLYIATITPLLDFYCRNVKNI